MKPIDMRYETKSGRDQICFSFLLFINHEQLEKWCRRLGWKRWDGRDVKWIGQGFSCGHVGFEISITHV